MQHWILSWILHQAWNKLLDYGGLWHLEFDLLIIVSSLKWLKTWRLFMLHGALDRTTCVSPRFGYVKLASFGWLWCLKLKDLPDKMNTTTERNRDILNLVCRLFFPWFCVCVEPVWLPCSCDVLERNTFHFFQMCLRHSVVGLVQLFISSFSSPSSSGLKTSCSDTLFLVFQKLHGFEAYLCSGLNSVLGSGWNTAAGPDTLQLTKCFSMPGRNTLIS